MTGVKDKLQTAAEQAEKSGAALRAGYGIRTITPKAMMPMAGFDLRQEKAVGVHDPLSVRALMLDMNGVKTALLVYDLLGVPMYLRDRVAKEVSPEFEKDHVILCAIHTHAAPKTHFRSFSVFDPAYEDQLVQAGREALAAAAEDLAMADLVRQEARAEGVASFRDAVREASSFSMPVDILTFVRSGENNSDPAAGTRPASKTGPVSGAAAGGEEAEKKDIRLIVMRTHPTVMNEKNFLMSRDLVFGMDTALLKEDGRTVNIFMNGACADVSTRYTRKEASFEEILRLGQRFADAVTAAGLPARSEASDGAPVENKPSVRFVMLRIPPAEFFSGEERQDILQKLEKKIEICKDEEEKREYIACRSVLLRPLYGKNPDGTPKNGEEVPITVLRLFEEDLIFLPFEYAFKDERVLKAAAEETTGRKAIVVCYANGYEGYLPTGRPLDENSGYEDMASSFRYDAKELIKETVLKLLQQREENQELL